ncbi:type II toxin-antitoxin system VapC family toxin [uncultured Paracoccus sp.]|uniref:type II toxin-antitoxin system VapC family toxin n=1 Tax=uncultured Paracoccus sp. TaxID=189685 RepID=UPI002634DCEC|nr:type II toxin-antitoxin system VapC family toxin [uncultured Paracoccus sp.]
MLILDTNVISGLRRPERAPELGAWLARQNDADLYLSVVTLGEIERGIARQDRQDPDFARDLRDWMTRTTQLFADRLLPVDAQSARIWGQLSAQLGHAGADLLIAATALRHDAVVVTRNVSDFLPTGCRIENPFD